MVLDQKDLICINAPPEVGLIDVCVILIDKWSCRASMRMK
jgi:hypothetical protein